MAADGTLAYDPQRLDLLAQKVREAIEYFDNVDSDEPMAADAIATARRISHRLSTQWLPALAGWVPTPR